MTCKHYRTTVTDSRSPDHINEAGYRTWKSPPYGAIVMRRRKCLDCGQKFLTAELKIEDIPDANSIKYDILSKLKLFIDAT